MIGRPSPSVPADGVLRLVAPAGVVDAAAVASATAALEGLGFAVEAPAGLVRADAAAPYLAGSDVVRATELVEALVAPGVDGVVCVRGGYGAMRLLPLLDGALGAPLRGASPRALVGFSDITALQGYLLRRLGWASLHGPLGKTLGLLEAGDQAALRAALRGEAARVEGLEVVHKGEATGVLLGGNLSLVCALVGTPWFPSLEGAILFIEEVGEQAYRIDRMLVELSLRGVLAGLAGLVVGELAPVGDRYLQPPAAEALLRGQLEALTARLGVPVAWGLPVGHGGRNLTLPVGRKARLSCTVEGGWLEVESATHLEPMDKGGEIA